MIENNNPMVSVIITTYNSQSEISDCIQRVVSQGIPCEILLTDNASQDKTLDVIKNLMKVHTGLKLFPNNRNLGLTAAINRLLPLCKGKYILILNPDAMIEENTIELLVEYMEQHPSVGIIGPLLLFPNGKPAMSYFRNWTLRNLVLWRLFPYSFLRYLHDHLVSLSEKEVFFVSGACILIRRDALLKVGGFDENFFVCLEDSADLSIRMRTIGFKTVFYPKARFIHLSGRSRVGLEYFSTAMAFYGELYYLRKHYGVVKSSIHWMILTIINIIKLFINLVISIFIRSRSRFSTRYAMLIQDLASGALLRGDGYRHVIIRGLHKNHSNLDF